MPVILSTRTGLRLQQLNRSAHPSPFFEHAWSKRVSNEPDALEQIPAARLYGCYLRLGLSGVFGLNVKQKALEES